MNVGNVVEYYAEDSEHQKIPWVRVTDPQGVVTVYRTEGMTNEPPRNQIRRMDCMDCHNRPSHIFNAPNQSVDLALALGRLDRAMPSIKFEAVKALTAAYETEDQAMQGIATSLHEKYADHPGLKGAIDVVQTIYKENFFPEMKSNWKVYPNNIGHKNWLGCFRCHDDQHKSVDGNKQLSMSNCNTCHTMVAEGNPEALEKFSLTGLKFKHPEEGWEGFMCNDCHTGSND
jgi:hypothetical protein